MIVNFQGHFIGIIVQVDEAIVQEESAITLLAITIINLITSLNIFNGFNNKTLFIIGICPRSLPWSLMIEHICVSNKSISFNTLYLYTKDSTGYHHSDLRILSYWELYIFWDLFTNQIVICFYIFNFFMNLIKEGASLKPLLLFICEENREV